MKGFEFDRYPAGELLMDGANGLAIGELFIIGWSWARMRKSFIILGWSIGWYNFD